MKAFFLIASLLMAPAIVRADGGVEFSFAQLVVRPGAQLVLRNDAFFDHHLALSNGPVVIRSETEGFLLPSHFRLIAADRNEFRFRMPRSAYLPGPDLAVNAGPQVTGQGFGLRGRMIRETLGEWEELEARACGNETNRAGCDMRRSVSSRNDEQVCGSVSEPKAAKIYAVVSKRKRVAGFEGLLFDKNGNVVADLVPVTDPQVVITGRRDVTDCGGPLPPGIAEGLKKPALPPVAPGAFGEGSGS